MKEKRTSYIFIKIDIILLILKIILQKLANNYNIKFGDNDNKNWTWV